MSGPATSTPKVTAAAWRAQLEAQAQRWLAPALAQLEKLRSRDRLLLATSMLALLAGLELLVVLPLRDKRLAIDAAQLNSEADEQQRQAQMAADALQRDEALQRRIDSVAASLAAVGATAAPRESLRFLLSRTLQGLPVTVSALRALPGEEIVVEKAETADALPADGAAAVPPPLFRHRYELQVQGSLVNLLAALQALEAHARPLRVERVRLSAEPGADPARALQARITLLTLGSERTWLAL